MADEKDLAQAAQQGIGPQPFQIWRHYKGGLYVVTKRSLKEDTLEPLVTYWSNAKGMEWTRTLANFVQPMDSRNGYLVPRFTRVTD